MAITVSNAEHIHTNSLMIIGGAYYLVQSVTGNTVTLDRKVPAGFEKAYVALAGIVDNSNEGHAPKVLMPICLHSSINFVISVIWSLRRLIIAAMNSAG